MNGNGKLGLAGKIEIVWRSYVWLLCALSFAVGGLVTELLRRVFL